MEIQFEWAQEEPYRIASDVELEGSRLVESHASFAAVPHIEATLARMKDHYEIDGNISTKVMIPCSRCLEPFLLPISHPLHLVLLPRPSYPGFVELELSDDDLDTSFYSEEKVVLEDLVSEQINLALPMRPLCSPDCKGLCLTCGTDLNRGSCTCR